ncbi:YybS family protein [Anaerospora sp.]|uniref:YybS family protein n=2 Tax=Anaerospora sp. TaxID=1960278 RepID=UPI0028A0DFBD|nr:YybS family protein [Anaerospora sp.]
MATIVSYSVISAGKGEFMQRQTQIKPMVEAGILASIAIMFAFMSAYLPVIGAFIHLVWPVPIMLLGVRHGVKWSTLATVVAGILIAVLLHPLHAVSVVVGFGLTGIVLGHGLREKFNPAKTLLWGSAASLISSAAVVAISMVVMGANPFTIQQEAMTKALEQAIDFYRQMGMKEEELQQMTTTMGAVMELLKIILPAGFALAAVVTAYLNFTVAKIVLKKLGYYVEPFPPFREWQMPKIALYTFVVAVLCMYWGHSREITWLYTVGVNVQMISMIFLIVQGLALFYYLADKYKLSRLIRGIILFLVFTNGIMLQVIIFAGAFDMAMNYRQMRSRDMSD